MSRTSLNGYEFGADPTTEAPFWGGGGDTPSDCYTKTESDARYAQKTQTYTKAEVDEMLSAKANSTAVYDKEETYSKSEADDLLAVKANASDVYTKTQTDNLLANKANSSDVYTKSQADGLLDDKANSADVYTKTQTDNLLSDKANSADVYTKTQTDNLLSDKANSADVYTKTQTYTKAEVDALISGGGGGGATIDDTTTSTTKTWSSNKISTELGTKANATDLQALSNVVTNQIAPAVMQTTQGLQTLSSNVYTKTETYTKSEVDAIISGGGSVDAYTKDRIDNIFTRYSCYNMAQKYYDFKQGTFDGITVEFSGTQAIKLSGTATDNLDIEMATFYSYVATNMGITSVKLGNGFGSLAGGYYLRIKEEYYDADKQQTVTNYYDFEANETKTVTLSSSVMKTYTFYAHIVNGKTLSNVWIGAYAQDSSAYNHTSILVQSNEELSKEFRDLETRVDAIKTQPEYHLAYTDTRIGSAATTVPVDGKYYDADNLRIAINGNSHIMSMGVKNIPYSNVKGSDTVNPSGDTIDITPEFYEWRDVIVKTNTIFDFSGISNVSQGFKAVKVKVTIIGYETVGTSKLPILFVMADDSELALTGLEVSYDYSSSYITLSPSVSPYA